MRIFSHYDVKWQEVSKRSPNLEMITNNFGYDEAKEQQVDVAGWKTSNRTTISKAKGADAETRERLALCR